MLLTGLVGVSENGTPELTSVDVGRERGDGEKCDNCQRAIVFPLASRLSLCMLSDRCHPARMPEPEECHVQARHWHHCPRAITRALHALQHSLPVSFISRPSPRISLFRSYPRSDLFHRLNLANSPHAANHNFPLALPFLAGRQNSGCSLQRPRPFGCRQEVTWCDLAT